jgi:uncharacterized iron-regulated membrane protein
MKVSPMTVTATQADPAPSTYLYRAVWRWHFYAGLFVIPFLIMLALTGTFMMIYSDLGNELGWTPNVTPTEKALTVSQQAKAALATVPGSTLATYIAPQATNRPAYFEVSKDGSTFAVAVDPYRGAILNNTNEGETWRATAEKIHGSLLLGKTGDWLIEIAASLSIIMVVTGLYLWWPRNQSFAAALLPRLSGGGRNLWKELHKVTGIWMSVFLVGFMLTGLAWTGVWGDQWAKPWSTFPATKWDKVPLSDLTHASLNHDIFHEVPWGLELTPLPESGSNVGKPAVPQPVAIDSVVQWAAVNGFKGQYRMAVPADVKGVFTVSIDGRNQDSASPSGDRYVHIDRYTGNILGEVRFADYAVGGKAVAWGIALHKGMVGKVNFVFNLVYMALVLFLCISGIVMWWKRRPQGALAAPQYPQGYTLSAGVGAMAVVLGLMFPLGGLAIVAFAVLDYLLPQRLKAS